MRNNRMPKSVREIVKILRTNNDDIRRRFKVTQMGLFGSFVRGEQKKRSDIDILVEFEKEGLTFDNYMELKFFLEDMFSTKIDLVIKDSIKETIKDFILEEVVYV